MLIYTQLCLRCVGRWNIIPATITWDRVSLVEHNNINGWEKFTSCSTGSTGLWGNRVTADDDDDGVSENETPWKHRANFGGENGTVMFINFGIYFNFVYNRYTLMSLKEIDLCSPVVGADTIVNNVEELPFFVNYSSIIRVV